MGQTFDKCVKADEAIDASEVYQLPARAIDNAIEKDGGGKKEKKKTRFLRWIKGRKGPAEREEPVAVKYVDKNNTDYISIPGYAKPIPREIALLILANDGDNVPEIVQLLEWQDFEKHYVMVLDIFPHCKNLSDFLLDAGNQITEKTAKSIMWQATKAAYMCYKREVFHRDIKLENFLINRDTLETNSSTLSTEDYFCPEYFKTSKYHAKSATVYSLGVLLFTLLCRRFPDSDDKNQMKNKIWSLHGFSKECCSLIEACLQENPKERILLEKIHNHAWLQAFRRRDSTPARQRQYEDKKESGVEAPHRQSTVRRRDSTFARHTGSQSKGKIEDEKQKNLLSKKNYYRLYKIGKKLCDGAVGSIYKARHIRTRRKSCVLNDCPLHCPGIPFVFLDFDPHHRRPVSEEELPTTIQSSPWVSHSDVVQTPGLSITPALPDLVIPGFDLHTSTEDYFCPEYFKTGKYHAKYSLGVLLFTLLCRRFPDSDDKNQMKYKIWSLHGFSKECSSLIKACLHENPKERILLEKIHNHAWIQDEHQTDHQQNIIQNPAHNESVHRLLKEEIPLRLAKDSTRTRKRVRLKLPTDSQLSEGEILLVTDRQLSEGEILLVTDSQLSEREIVLVTDSQLSEGEIPLITDSQLSEGEIPLVTDSQLSEGEIPLGLITDSQLSEGEIPLALITDSQLSEGEILLVTGSPRSRRRMSQRCNVKLSAISRAGGISDVWCLVTARVNIVLGIS
ncbi:Serine/threonine-protein kinase pim-3 [Triplophysa tibetana]|uniref:non-specific serine/threonine protein kinase n=1 Tax=Triplophysa tibetana TaxID=1572043 RepID=A0A5A9NA05_9TELE|nr:Serine/threonine-protein kinase pim-3 [Triplophysa tibetana]